MTMIDDFQTLNLDSDLKGGEKRLHQRKQIAILHKNNVPARRIAWFSQSHLRMVKRWIIRIESEQTISDHPRSGRPAVFTEDICLKVIAFFCQQSPLPGCSSWSLRWAEAHFKEHQELLDCTISRASIQRILKMHALRPHKQRYFLQITDPDFFPKMEHIVRLYINPPDYLFCFDECTGIQALQRLTPDLPAEKGQPRRREFQYKRNGTSDLMAFLHPATGDIFGRCTPDHTTKTLIKVFTEHVKQQPDDAALHYICDNYNTHYQDKFCKAVAKLSHVKYKPLKTGKERRTWLQSEDKRIMVHFLPFHGSWLNMIEIWFGLLKNKCLKDGWFESVTTLRQAISDFIQTWNTYFAHPFTWTYNGEDLYGKVIRRFIKLLQIESQQMEINFLTKQLFLMKNLAQDYWVQVDNHDWERLFDLVTQKDAYIKELIASGPKEKQRLKATQSLTELTSVLSDNLVDEFTNTVSYYSLCNTQKIRHRTCEIEHLEGYAPVLKSA
jgi:transposase